MKVMDSSQKTDIQTPPRYENTNLASRLVMQNQSLSYSTVIFDCDGIILLSNKLKTYAFSNALKNEPQKQREQFIRWHMENGGISRYKKFEYYYKHIKTIENPDLHIEKAIMIYEKILNKELEKCSLADGLIDLLEMINAKKVLCCVNSGGKQKEIVSLFAKKNLTHWFQCILGSPSTKEENMDIIKSKGFMEQKTIMIGDSKSDMDAAIYAKIDFALITHASEWKNGIEQTQKHGGYVFHDLNEFRKWFLQKKEPS